MADASGARQGKYRLPLTIALNYAAQMYVALLAIVMVPVYLGLLGAEAYGLVAFLAMVHAWSQMLDFGFSATASREASRHLAGTSPAGVFRRLLRGLELLFWPVGALLLAALVASSGRIASGWLQPRELSAGQVELALTLMACAVALRWISGLYRGVLVGLERQIWLNGFVAAAASVRFIGVLPVLWAVSERVTAFFVYEAVVSLVELAVLVATCRRALPASPRGGARLRGTGKVLRGRLRFAASIGVASVVWVAVNQIDKAVISARLRLDDFGVFSAAVLIAGGISLLSAAVAQAVLPRLTQLAERRAEAELLALYRHTTRWAVVVGAPLTLVLAIFPAQVLTAWTGQPAFAQRFAEILSLYSVGNGFMALSAFTYALQYARGDLRLHLRGNIALGVTLPPALAYAGWHFGPIGTGWVWAAFNCGYFFLWSWLVHRRFAPGLHWRWLWREVGLASLAAAAVALAAALAVPWPQDRFGVLAGLMAVGLAMVAAAALAARPRGQRKQAPAPDVTG